MFLEYGENMDYQEGKIGTKEGRKGPSKMAEGIALQRMAESMLPENERIFFDPYAIHFVDHQILEWARDHPLEAKAIADEFERKMPGWSNSIRARIRYFDDVVQNVVGEGFNQMVILGAGYDSRAYCIDGLRGHIQVFEVDHPQTIERKTEIITRILGVLPEHVAFVPLNLEYEDLWENLKTSGYSPTAKTLFVLEGLVMYLSRDAVEELFSGIVRNSGDGSSILFDYIPQSFADGTSDREGGRNILDYTVMAGEPIRSGFADGEVHIFLSRLGFSGVEVIPSSVYGKMYYSGKNASRPVSGLLFFASASVRDRFCAMGDGADV